jgi:phosphate-selective porin OprO/OprP
MKLKWLWVAAVMIGAQTGIGAAEQESLSPDEIKALRKQIEELEKKVKRLEEKANPPEPKARIDELDQKVKVIERNRELDQEAAEAKVKENPKLVIGADGFGLSSADDQFKLQLKGVLQVDSRTFFGDSGIRGNDGFLLRRARPILQGTLWGDLDFLFVPDFGGTGNPQIFDAYANYRYRPELQLRAGKFKSPVGLEQLMADVDILFNERSLVTDLVPNRDIGVQLHGEVLEGAFSYAVGIFNGVGDARNSSNFDFEDDKAFEGRVFFQPFKKVNAPALQGFGFGLSGSYEDIQGTNITALPSTTGGTLSGYTTDGQQQFFAYNPASNAVVVADGPHWRLSPQGYYYYGPFGFLGEYIISNQRVSRSVTAPFASAHLDNRAWQVSGSWILTGEDAAYKGGVNPRRPFKPSQGGWGAWQLVARYEQLDLDEAAFPLFANPNTSARSAAAWSVGLSWYLNRNVAVKTSFSHTDFTGGGGSGGSVPATVTRKDENVLFTRIQLAF